MSNDVNYKLPSGFDIELLPGEKRLENRLLRLIQDVFERYGFTPIETPAVERLDVLQAKGNQGDNIIYSLTPILPERNDASGDDGKEGNRALKFDQTVPLAAYIARHKNDLTFPFARYQMDMVFRGERAKKGRYRQFRQCDIDVVGDGKLSLLYDAQIPAIITEIFEAMQIGDFVVRMNNRKVLTGFFTAINVEADTIRPCIRVLDTLEKVGPAKVSQELQSMGLTSEQVDRILEFVGLQGSVDEILMRLEAIARDLGEAAVFNLGIAELKDVVSGVRALGVGDNRFCLDLTIARGLDYYTGTVYETALIGYESLGSICSGGRYEELVGMFAGKTMPGVGISIGLTRLMRKLMEIGKLHPESDSPAEVMIFNSRRELIGSYFKLSQDLRKAGINVLTFLESLDVGKQFKRAEKLGIPLAVLMDQGDYENGSCRLKDLRSGEQMDLQLDQLVAQVKTWLGH